MCASTDIFFAFVSVGRDHRLRQMFAAAGDGIVASPKVPAGSGSSKRSRVNRRRHCRDSEFPVNEELHPPPPPHHPLVKIILKNQKKAKKETKGWFTYRDIHTYTYKIRYSCTTNNIYNN